MASLASALNPFVLFLDIDGVLTNNPMTQKTVEAKAEEIFQDRYNPENDIQILHANTHYFDPTALNNLTSLLQQIEKTQQVWIILSSSWKRGYTLDTLKTNIFHLLPFTPYLKDTTPDLLFHHPRLCTHPSHKPIDPACRAAEIRLWLANHPDIVDYVIVDDVDSHLSDQYRGRFYHTKMATLLTQEICQAILKRPVPASLSTLAS